MNYLESFSFFKKSKKPIELKNPSFKQVIVNLQKLIDLECPDKIGQIEINYVSIENKTNEIPIIPHYHYLDSIITIPKNDDNWMDRDRLRSSIRWIEELQRNRTSSRNRIIYVDEMAGTIVVKLNQDESNFLSMTFCYNKQYKISMNTWSTKLFLNNSPNGPLLNVALNDGGIGYLLNVIEKYLIETNIIF